MAGNSVPLREKSIEELFLGNDNCVYEIPIYQRNYAWEKDEITALVQDIYDSFIKPVKKPYYIGTLVTYHKGGDVYEIIDGQQRLTTIWLLLCALGIKPQKQLTYRARKRSDNTLKMLVSGSGFDEGEKDTGIVNGFHYVQEAIRDKAPDKKKEEALYEQFKNYFRNSVHIIHYCVPNDIDLNHYFEVMNSRGEQLEKHEIVKALLMQELDDAEKKVFNCIWEGCSEMGIYIQQSLPGFKSEDIFGDRLCEFVPSSFAEICLKSVEGGKPSQIALKDIISLDDAGEGASAKEEERKDSFLPIIDFPNFLIIVLKLTLMDEEINENDSGLSGLILDDKELLKDFTEPRMEADTIRKFAYNLLKARFFLDNYVVHHSKENDTVDNNPWKLQVWQKQKEEGKKEISYPKNLSDDSALQDRLQQLLSMFEVSFSARQRKNYLLYCLLFLMRDQLTGYREKTAEYAWFVERLADRFFNEVYLDSEKMNLNNNTPKPGSFDVAVLDGKELRKGEALHQDKSVFNRIYGDGTEKSNGVPLFVFNYLDYQLWKLYYAEARGEDKGSTKRREFFKKLGCSDFELDVFKRFYFSRTRRSLEHYFPQANVIGEEGDPNDKQIDCFGNYAMIGSEANSSGSNWSPSAKVTHYLDKSQKINPVSVASLKFWIMMQMCKDNKDKKRDEDCWTFDEIRKHQEIMVGILTGSVGS